MAPAAPLVRQRLCGDLQQPITALAWFADGEFLAIASAGGELLLLDFRAGCEELLRGERDSSLDVVGFSSDGQFLMAAGQSGELLLWELGGTGLRPLALEPMPLGGGWIDAAAWQPGGLLLAVAAGRELRLWDGANRQWREPPLDLPGTIQALAWSADGEQLAASCHGELVLWQPCLSAPADPPLRNPIASAGLALAFSGPGSPSGLRDAGSLPDGVAQGGPGAAVAVQRLSGQGAPAGLERAAGTSGTAAGQRGRRGCDPVDPGEERRQGLATGTAALA
ncbi:WD40 repeat domain-containing protein [Cyanobium sp. FGCU-52]|nr:WD40 repeat domain-containing protein [Cyanobium sp. FGCU52]